MKRRIVALGSKRRLASCTVSLMVLSLLIVVFTAVFTAPALAAAIKSVQNGSATFGAGSTSTTATLSPAVDLSRSFLVFNLRASAADPDHGTVSGQITNGTTVTFQRVGSTGSVTIEWYVAEFASGVSVQRGDERHEPEPELQHRAQRQ
jgi:hypothetical protein